MKATVLALALGLAGVAGFGQGAAAVGADRPRGSQLEAGGPPPASTNRPTVGLVLGGGGALGIAHVGVLQVLEDLRVPVDYIGGTSMGAIIAGFYASGLSADEIDTILTELDWWDIMKDQTPYRDLDFRRKEESARYLLDLELGLRGYRVLLPHGFAAGQKFNNLLQILTVNAAGVEDFDDLNIPYRAVATDLRSGGPVVLERGNLASAMRASMAVPGVFTPVEIGSHLLVDGGLVNNIPVDVVKAMGADIVIAVDVGSSGAVAGQKGDFRSMGQILGRTYAIMQRTKDDPRRQAADILIEPDLVGLAAGDFHRAAELIPRGQTAAEAHAGELRRLAVDEATYATWQARHEAKHTGSVTIRAIEVSGNSRISTNMILRRVETKPGDVVDFDRLRRDVARVHGMGDFQTVTQRLIPTGKPGEYDLRINTVEKYWGPTYVHMGLRLETDFEENSTWNFLLNIRRSALNALGGEVRLDLEGGQRQGLLLEWYQPLQARALLFVAPAIDVETERQNIFEDGEKIAEYKRDAYLGRFDVGMQYKQYGELRAGVAAGELQASPEVGEADLPSADPQMGAFTTRLTLDRLDARVFPRRGTYLGLDGWFSSESLGADDTYNKLDWRLQWVKSVGDHTGVAGFRGGHALGGEIPAYDQFTVGGFGSFPGLASGELRGSYYDTVSLVYRYRIGRLTPSLGQGVYTLVGAAAGNCWDDSSDIDADDLITGGLVGIALDTIVGPIAIAGSQAEGGRSAAYFTLGTLF